MVPPPAARCMMYMASSEPSSVPDTEYIAPASLLTRTIWPLAGYNKLSSTPPKERDPRPVQFMTRSAGLPLLCVPAAAASWMCFRDARFKWTPFLRHCDSNQGRYTAVLMQTDVKTLASLIPFGKEDAGICRNYDTISALNRRPFCCQSVFLTSGNRLRHHGFGDRSSENHSAVAEPASFFLL